MHTAGVICEDMTMSITAKQVPTTIIYVTTAIVSHDSTYKSHDTTPTASVVAIVGTVGALILLAAYSNYSHSISFDCKIKIESK